MDEPVAVAPEIHDDEHFITGDFTLISSDNVRFRVSSQALLAAKCGWSFSSTDARSVFCDASKASTAGDTPDSNKQEIRFSDEDFEDADTISRFLHLITEGHVNVIAGDCRTCHVNGAMGMDVMYEESTWDEDGRAQCLMRLVRFMLKYMCHSWLCIMLRDMHLRYHEDLATFFETFAVCAAALHEEYCAQLVGSAVGRSVPLESLDPRSWTIHQWRLIPTNYSWALNHTIKSIEAVVDAAGVNHICAHRARTMFLTAINEATGKHYHDDHADHEDDDGTDRYNHTYRKRDGG